MFHNAFLVRQRLKPSTSGMAKAVLMKCAPTFRELATNTHIPLVGVQSSVHNGPVMAIANGQGRKNSFLRKSEIAVAPLQRKQQQRFFSISPEEAERQRIANWRPMTDEEELEERARVLHLSPQEKDQELRKLNREIFKLEMLKGINTGELYTLSGKYKMLLNKYGLPLIVWYWAIWGTTGVALYGAMAAGGVDATAVLMKIDGYLQWDLASRVDPRLGLAGIALVLNEVIEPARLPFVLMTVKPVMDRVYPPKI